MALTRNTPARVILRVPGVGALLVAFAACGGLVGTDDAPAERLVDASSHDASSDSTFVNPVGDAGTPSDSSLEASPSPDAFAHDASDAHEASDGSDSTADSFARDASDVSDSTADSFRTDAAKEHSPCDDDCALGDQQCSRLPQVCTYNDAGFTVGCEPQGQGIWTCVVGDAGCTVWADGLACKPDVPCCVACEQGVCPLGSEGDPCEQDTDCASDACDAILHECVSNQCADHRQDGLESDVDCGGPLCNSCRGGQRCRSNGDCKAGQVCSPSLVCSGPTGSTSDASASDAAADAAPCDDECALGDQECSRLPQVCTYDDAGFTASCEAPGEGFWTCVVGNAGCAVWAPGLACGSDVACCAGCAQVACDAGPRSLCWTCPPGSAGEPCEQDTDCVSDACDALTHECIADQCADHRQDGQETDVDCGGPVCSTCQAGQACQSNLDCQAGHICVNNGYAKVCT